jgi:hypothetical protein
MPRALITGVSGFIGTGIHIFESAILSYLVPHQRLDLPNLVLKLLKEKSRSMVITLMATGSILAVTMTMKKPLPSLLKTGNPSCPKIDFWR